MKKTTLTILCALCALCVNLYAQNEVLQAIDHNYITPDRLSFTLATNAPPTPVESLTYYNALTHQITYWDGTNWVGLGQSDGFIENPGDYTAGGELTLSAYKRLMFGANEDAQLMYDSTNAIFKIGDPEGNGGTLSLYGTYATSRIDLNEEEIILEADNVELGKVGSGAVAIQSPFLALRNHSDEPGPSGGRVYYDNVLNKLRYSDGTEWISLGPSKQSLSVRISGYISTNTTTRMVFMNISGEAKSITKAAIVFEDEVPLGASPSAFKLKYGVAATTAASATLSGTLPAARKNVIPNPSGPTDPIPLPVDEYLILEISTTSASPIHYSDHILVLEIQ